jgi:hypothetical protein
MEKEGSVASLLFHCCQAAEAEVPISPQLLIIVGHRSSGNGCELACNPMQQLVSVALRSRGEQADSETNIPRRA